MADPASALSTPADRVMRAIDDVQRKAHEPSVEGTKEALRRLNANAPDLVRKSHLARASTRTHTRIHSAIF